MTFLVPYCNTIYGSFRFIYDIKSARIDLSSDKSWPKIRDRLGGLPSLTFNPPWDSLSAEDFMGDFGDKIDTDHHALFCPEAGLEHVTA